MASDGQTCPALPHKVIVPNSLLTYVRIMLLCCLGVLKLKAWELGKVSFSIHVLYSVQFLIQVFLRLGGDIGELATFSLCPVFLRVVRGRVGTGGNEGVTPTRDGKYAHLKHHLTTQGGLLPPYTPINCSSK